MKFIDMYYGIEKEIKSHSESLKSLKREMDTLPSNYTFGSFSINAKHCSRQQSIVLVGILNERIQAAIDCKFSKEEREFKEMKDKFLYTQNLRHKIDTESIYLEDWEDMFRECKELMTLEEKRQMFSETVERVLED